MSGCHEPDINNSILHGEHIKGTPGKAASVEGFVHSKSSLELCCNNIITVGLS